jgi:hypothetical protein
MTVCFILNNPCALCLCLLIILYAESLILRNIPDCSKVTRLWNADRDKNRDNKNNSDNKAKGKNRDKGENDLTIHHYFFLAVLTVSLDDLPRCYGCNIPYCVRLSASLTCSLLYMCVYTMVCHSAPHCAVLFCSALLCSISSCFDCLTVLLCLKSHYIT